MKQQVPNLNQSQENQADKVELRSSQFYSLIDLTTNDLRDEIKSNLPLQWSLLKYLINHPEKVNIVSNPEWLDKDPRSIFDKLKKYLQLLGTYKEKFSKLGLLADFDNADKYHMENEIEQAEEPDGEYNARQICAKLQSTFNKVTRFNCAFNIIYSKDNDSASLYARQLVGLSDDSDIDPIDFSLDSSLPKTNYTLMKDGVPILEDQNFYVLMGKEKSGKSHILPVFLAAYLFGSLDEFGFKSMIAPDSKILYIDTEQSMSDALNICQTANLLAGKKYNTGNERLIISSCDVVSTAKMLQKIQSKIDRYKPKVVFIDGYAGLVEDVYKSTGVDTLMKEVRKMARTNDLVIIGVFHEKRDDNPLLSKKESSSAFGAAGKLFERYAGGTFSVTNEEGTITVTNTKSRKAVCPTFHCKLDGRIYIDIPGKEEPDFYPVADGNTREVLEPMHKTVNDIDVHSFAVPHYLSEGEYNEVVDSEEARQEQAEMERKIQKQEAKEKANIPKYEELISTFFKEKDFLSDDELCELWKLDRKTKEGFKPEDKVNSATLDRWRTARCRDLTAAKKLGILFKGESGKWGFRVVSNQQQKK